MGDTPVSLSLQLLSTLSSQAGTTGIGVNELFRLSGINNKPLYVKSRRYLENAQIIQTLSDSTRLRKKAKGKKKIQVLTNIGREFSELRNSIQEYKSSYDQLEDKIKNYYDVEDTDKARDSKLRNKGLDDREVFYTTVGGGKSKK